MNPSRPRLMMLITEDWYFWSHRLDLARAARDAGYDVSLATRVAQHGSRIEAEGIRLFPISLERRSRKPFQEMASIAELIGLYERERPAIVHHVAMKPIIYGAVAAQLARVPVVVNAFAGLGTAFTEENRGRTLLGPFLRSALRFALSRRNATTIFQNEDDRSLLIDERIITKDRTRVIRGAGVNLNQFRPAPLPEGRPLVLLAARMLWDKGVKEFVEAARILRTNGSDARCVLVGQIDRDNPTAIPESQLSQWVQSGAVEWWGHREDMPEVLSQATVVVLPSYREGLPKVLLEAAACRRPVIATDVPGCREIVLPKVNGLLVAPRESAPLAEAIARLLADPAQRAAMADRGRELVEREFSVEAVARQTLDLYRELSGRNGNGATNNP